MVDILIVFALSSASMSLLVVNIVNTETIATIATLVARLDKKVNASTRITRPKFCKRGDLLFASR